ncbi:MAG: 50S ribosomal protein L10 [Candidatus Aenigmarchaeota archaeon]|nr:50S ribosomal protein L10 [Candidatus Aenigmarchaeota archaeon]
MASQKKQDDVKTITEEIKNCPVVGIADLSGLPSKELQEIRKALRGTATIIMNKKTVITRAVASCGKKDIGRLSEFDVHIPSLILSKTGAFKLYKQISKSKSKAYAKAGDIAPYDIIVPEGETNLPPGPAISDLQKAGVKSAIMGNKIVVREDSQVAKKGDAISDVVANVLQKVDIKPMEIGMNLVAAYENGFVFGKEVLSVSEEEYISNMQKAYTQSFNLAFNANILVKEIVPHKLFDAHTKALNLAINANILNKETVSTLLQKANMQMLSIAGTLPKEAGGVENAAPAAEAPKEEKKKEEKEENKEENAAAGLGALFG